MEYTIMQQIPVAINAALTHCNYLSAGNDENSDFSTTSPLNQKQKNLFVTPETPESESEIPDINELINLIPGKHPSSEEQDRDIDSEDFENSLFSPIPFLDQKTAEPVAVKTDPVSQLKIGMHCVNNLDYAKAVKELSLLFEPNDEHEIPPYKNLSYSQQIIAMIEYATALSELKEKEKEAAVLGLLCDPKKDSSVSLLHSLDFFEANEAEIICEYCLTLQQIHREDKIINLYGYYFKPDGQMTEALRKLSRTAQKNIIKMWSELFIKYFDINLQKKMIKFWKNIPQET